MRVLTWAAGCAALALPTLAMAEPASADAAPAFAVAVEPLGLAKGKGGFTGQAFTVADYNFAASTSAGGGGGGVFSVTVMGSTKAKLTVTVKYSLARADAPVSAGTCKVAAKVWSGLWNSATNSLYSCVADPGGSGPADFALEAVVPEVAPQSGWPVAISRDKDDQFKLMKARMRYAGAVYEAVPTGLKPEEAASHRRVATGWLISRDGKPVGRLDFPERKGMVMDVNGSWDRKSIITAPKAEADGREAVILFAAQLIMLPEGNSPIGKM